MTTWDTPPTPRTAAHRWRRRKQLHRASERRKYVTPYASTSGPWDVLLGPFTGQPEHKEHP